jgi:quinolinate synthase
MSAQLQAEINRLKKQKNAVILAHYYCAPDIVGGVADFRGDSYALADYARRVREENIIFCGVYFMAQTAKILNPGKNVFLPPVTAGCSLADAVDAAQVKELRSKYPKADFLCYINSTAQVKAQCDICVTSSNVYDIAAKSKARQIVFLPDVFMAANVQRELKKRGIEKEVIPFGGTCCVHDKYTTQDVAGIRKSSPAAKIICHPECAPEVCELCDYTGSTSGMLKYVKESPAQEFAVLSETGIIDCLERENPQKTFLKTGRVCASMKRNNLQNILAALQSDNYPQVEVPQEAARGALHMIERMFKETHK